MIKVLFFAQVRELVGVSELCCGSQPDVESLRCVLESQGESWARALEPNKLLVAVNQCLVPFSHPLQEGDEVAFFPPVTGG